MHSLIADMTACCLKHNHEIRSKHIAVVIKNGRPISEYKFNHLREGLLGLPTNTVHAEMAAINELYKQCCNNAGLSRADANIIGKVIQYLKGIYSRYTHFIHEDGWYVLCR
jgi:hypothetical protein